MRVSITGANGHIGRILVADLARDHELRAGVALLPPGREPGDLPSSVEQVSIELEDVASLRGLVRGADVVVHLAGEREVEAPWSRLVGPNLTGVANLFEAAAELGVGRVVYASSNHVIGGYSPAEQRGFNGSEAVRPDTPYGVSKAFGELVARYYADRRGLSAICLRIGWVLERPFRDEAGEAERMWLSPRDLCQLVRGALTTPVRFGVYYGCSNNRSNPWDLGPARRDLGFVPLDDAAVHLEDR